MYNIGILSKDSVHELKDIPQSSVGAPCPMVLADEHHLYVFYYLQNTPEDWDGSTVRVVGPETRGEPVAIITFSGFIAYYHGCPNDETFSGHPLYKKGLGPYGAYEIKKSSWIRRLMEMNRVHPCHKDSNFEDYRHFILSFHDTTFECIAENYLLEITSGSILQVAKMIMGKFENL